MIDGIIGPQRLLVESMSGLQPQQNSGLENSGLDTSALHDLQVANASLDRPTATQAADFARAAADATVHGAPTRDVPSVREVQATHPPAGHWSDWIARHMKDLESSLKFPDAGAGRSGGTSPAKAPHILESGNDAVKKDAITNNEFDRDGSISDGLAHMKGAYTFAIKATLASRGSTESTKIFNTLLKGG